MDLNSKLNKKEKKSGDQTSPYQFLGQSKHLSISFSAGTLTCLNSQFDKPSS